MSPGHQVTRSLVKAKIFASLIRLADWRKAMRAYRKKDLDGLELRLDAFSPLELTRLHALVALEKHLPPILVTVRSKREGGLQVLSTRERMARFKLFMPFAALLDCELSSKDLLRWISHETRRYQKGLIVSYHDFKKTPSRVVLKKILLTALRQKPSLTKIAVTTRSQNDLSRLVSYLAEFHKKGLVVIAMGKIGSVSRILFPVLGSCITFGHLGSEAAPGQIPVRVLASRLRRLAL